MLRFVLRSIRNLLCVPLLPIWAIARWLSRPKGRWIVVRLKPRLVEVRQPLPWLRRVLDAGSLRRTSSLAAVRRLADYAISDSRIEGLAFVLPPLQAGWSVCVGLREQILRLRDEGKRTAVLLPRGGGHRELYVASAAEQIYVAPQATITLLGLSAQSHYVKPLLDRIGVEVEPFARKEYKTAVERMSRDSMSEYQREQVQALIDGHTTALLEALSQRIGTTPEQTRTLFEVGVFRGQDAIDARLADALAYEDELPSRLGLEQTKKKKKKQIIEADRYLAFKEAKLFRPLRRQPYIAVIAIKGAISESGAPMGRRASIVAALRHARRDRRALGVLLWVDSPGGSAEASDLIHREVVRVKEKKPVVAYFGEVAASGGYYVAAHADAIVAQPLGLTGSIGVVSARLMASQLLDRVGIRTEVLRTGPHADMFSPHRPLTDGERVLMNRELDAFYDSFVALVADGRGRPVEDIEPLARGRVWLAADAHRHGLIDELGGMDTALDRLRDSIDVPPRLRERLRPMVVASYRLEPPPPAAQLGLEGSVFEGVRDLALLLCEGPGVLYHVISIPRIR
ncbi:MAG: signal peptide peptidase SppA [Deltaproteobacteria bacterium]|nr:signal peptide peptidase SppA [Deltaproteobacteria bacterium]MBW2211571.1 signal peptide peptidase SppA [Deltaproteobacteria bacterium]MBW2550251.1 signal peptide peptidase SppA [Deltaproteobacteria bacterium]MBW2626366.1 signal peptide peptidase SppA [Deltaproteobacteria bacterium]MBW2684796.1 signal peptide peptidase SppA [Deltaproteobacteria bacterium]